MSEVNRFENKTRRVFNNITSILQILFSIIGVIAFWYFILNTDYLADWYPKIGTFIASHGGLIAGSLWLWLHVKRRSFREQWDMWFKKGNDVKKNDYN